MTKIPIIFMQISSAIGMVGGLAILTFILIAVMYNGHVSRRNAADNALSAIDVQLKKRWNLIPQLVATAKGYAAHEKAVFERVTMARSEARHARDWNQRALAEGQISTEIPSIVALAEAYPELKADQQFMNLQRNLTEIESQISAARRAFNSATTAYNDGVQMFPSNIIAGVFGFKARDLYAIDAIETSVPQVK
ncbi:LemA family protein [Rubritalea marina]|uniref:LemA family protein n=1 Tax=Rubritalea marina TaxID=361055 RepID=UPI00037DDFED|nr:LemA family protein [Rubritalea marina]